MQPITCEACRQPTPAHDVVNYGSMEGGYRQLCGRCFNEAAASSLGPVSYTHLRAHETVLDLVCRLLLVKNTHNRPLDKNNVANTNIYT